ncbi:hypothetical protein RRG08_062727 [Elysia crispata]|uniref:Uncharacterized protein n=1 Tax=Elysia crispata TaxID=231223 RepID=A0AAE1ACA4_9GAST|nr:hypothetical protein RRG08_062727 [Elysia crispata]
MSFLAWASLAATGRPGVNKVSTPGPHTLASRHTMTLDSEVFTEDGTCVASITSISFHPFHLSHLILFLSIPCSSTPLPATPPRFSSKLRYPTHLGSILSSATPLPATPPRFSSKLRYPPPSYPTPVLF